MRFARQANDIASEAVRRHPTRFRAFATLPTADSDAAVAELERAVGLEFVGAMVYGRTGTVPLDDPRYDDLFAAAARLGRPIFIHPQIPPHAIRRAAYSGFDPMTDLALATFGLGWHLEAAVSALRLIVRGTFDRHPNLQLVLGHWGELLLFWSDRTDSLARVVGLDRKVSEYVRSNVHTSPVRVDDLADRAPGVRVLGSRVDEGAGTEAGAGGHRSQRLRDEPQDRIDAPVAVRDRRADAAPLLRGALFEVVDDESSSLLKRRNRSPWSCRRGR